MVDGHIIDPQEIADAAIGTPSQDAQGDGLDSSSRNETPAED